MVLAKEFYFIFKNQIKTITFLNLVFFSMKIFNSYLIIILLTNMLDEGSLKISIYYALLILLNLSVSIIIFHQTGKRSFNLFCQFRSIFIMLTYHKI
jgi:hypothetical protein